MTVVSLALLSEASELKLYRLVIGADACNSGNRVDENNEEDDRASSKEEFAVESGAHDPVYRKVGDWGGGSVEVGPELWKASPRLVIVAGEESGLYAPGGWN